MSAKSLPVVLVPLLLSAAAHAGALVDAGPPFGRLPLVDEIECARADTHHFAESPKGASRVETVLGRPCRVVPNAGGARYVAWRVGEGRGLEAGRAYVLAVEFPEDRPRTMFILNRGCETARGVATGAALGDVLYTYSNNNVESLQIPLSGEYRAWTMLFWLHDRFPDLAQPRGDGPRPRVPRDGFWVLIAQSSRKNAPLSAGAAVARVRLFAVPDPAKLDLGVRLPPEGLPRRHLFWREEMSDGVIHSRKPAQRGVTNETDWFEHKARLMRFLGVNTFCKDLLEFGHNQGWDATAGGGNDWYWQSKTPKRWQQILAMLAKYDVSVLPYYEYCGGMGQHGLGKERRCRTLAGTKTYTHIKWSEIANIDVTDPDALADAIKLLDATIVRHKDKARFLGAWFRTRPSNMPVSFADRCLFRFAIEANNKRVATRDDLKKDKALLAKYYAWWLEKRKQFLVALRDHLRAHGIPEAVILFTATAAEPGPPLVPFKNRVVTDDMPTWQTLLSTAEHEKASPYPYADACNGHLAAALRPPATWGHWEWQHSIPPPDPARYADVPGILMTYPYNRAYTVASPAAFDAFRTVSGLAAVRHHPLNESVMDKLVGYFVCDVERAGPYCMLGEVRAMAHGDPWYLGALAAASHSRGFPRPVRAFNAAFLALPALPSTLLPDAASDPAVVVRSIATERHGTWLAIVNTALVEKQAVTITLPRAGKATDAASGEALPTAGAALRLTLPPCSLRAVRIR